MAIVGSKYGNINQTFNANFYNKGNLDLTKHLFEALDSAGIEYLKTTLPCGPIGNSKLDRFCVKSIKLKTIWKDNGRPIPWDYIIDEVRHRCCSKHKTPIFLSLTSVVMYDPKDFSSMGGLIIRFHEGFGDKPSYTIYGKRC